MVVDIGLPVALVVMWFGMVQGALGSSNEILRCAAGEALGRIVQVVGESKFIADMAQYSFDRFITNTHYLATGRQADINKTLKEIARYAITLVPFN